MREEGDSSNTGSPVGGAHAPTGNPRGPAWAGGVAERLVVPEKLGNAGGGEGASVREQRKKEARTWRLVETPNSSRSVRTLQTALHAKAFRGRRHDLVREPGAGKPHARFDERGEETWLRWGLRHRLRAKAAGNSYSPHLRPGAPLLDSTCAVERRCVPAGANPARQLSLQPEAVGAVQGGNELH